MYENIYNRLSNLPPHELVKFCYINFLGREPEGDVVERAVKRFSEEFDKLSFVNEVLTSNECVSRFLALSNEKSLQNQSGTPLGIGIALLSPTALMKLEPNEFIRACYLLFLRRLPDEGGYEYYRQVIAGPEGKLGVLSRFLRSKECALRPELILDLATLVRMEQRSRNPLWRFIYERFSPTYRYLRAMDHSADPSDLFEDYQLIKSGQLSSQYQAPAAIAAARSAAQSANSMLPDSAILLSVEMLLSLKSETRPRIAIVSVNANAQTGIANFNSVVFGIGDDAAFDIFCPISGADDFMHINASAGAAHHLSLESLQFALKTLAYQAVIVVLGNSSDNLPAARMLETLSKTKHGVPLYVHIHDPFLFNIAKHLLDERDASAIKTFLGHLDEEDEAAIARMNNGNFSDLIARNVTGLCHIISHPEKISGIICNSKAGMTIIANDKTLTPLPAIYQLFHPVLDPFQKRAPRSEKDRALLIGSFGAPGGDKASDVVVEGFRILRRSYPNAQLVLAGYNAKKFVNRLKSPEDGESIIGAEPEETVAFMNLMAECDLAVQLRRENRGESSGVIPQLVSLDIPVLVSKVGALAEFGDAVSYIDCKATPRQLANAMEEEFLKLAEDNPHRGAYCAKYSVSAFRQGILKIISQLNSAPKVDAS
ncbi:glycosyltransferase family protein [Acidocella facilis]|uniref:hypothetical protein n=1 Tax=Acidocella facilis TaxID=525 RepID=UPI001F280F43|nr:hypothetical protein [Acidocella facilis]